MRERRPKVLERPCRHSLRERGHIKRDCSVMATCDYTAISPRLLMLAMHSSVAGTAATVMRRRRYRVSSSNRPRPRHPVTLADCDAGLPSRDGLQWPRPLAPAQCAAVCEIGAGHCGRSPRGSECCWLHRTDAPMSTDVGPVASAVRAPRVMILRAPTRQIRRIVAPLLAPQASHPWSCERVDDICRDATSRPAQRDGAPLAGRLGDRCKALFEVRGWPTGAISPPVCIRARVIGILQREIDGAARCGAR
jgi:hypothetical protein